MKFTLVQDGVQVFGSVSPCSWMYPNYGLQIQLSLAENPVNAASEFVNDKAVQAYEVPRDVLLQSAQKLAEAWLAANGTQKLTEAEARWAAAKAQFDIDSKKRAEEKAKKDAARIVKMKKQGYTHRFNAWIHPAHGDDYQVEAFIIGAPTAAQIKQLLAKSTVKTDYTVKEI